MLDARLLEAWIQCELRSWLEVHAASEAAAPDGLERLLTVQRADLLELLTTQARDGIRWTVSSRPERVGPPPKRPSGTVGAAFRAPLTGIPGATSPIGLEVSVRGSVDLVEVTPTGTNLVVVAAGTRVRDHHLRRLALAAVVGAASGLSSTRSYVLTVDRAGSPGPATAGLRPVDVSDRARQEAQRTPLRLTALAASLACEQQPATDIGPHCRRPRRCPFVPYCWAPYRGRSIYHVAGLRPSSRRALRSAGWIRLDDVPAAAPWLTPAESASLRDAREGRVRIDRSNLQALLATLVFPIAYLDLEFATPAVPLVEGMASFEPLPFQFSVDLERRAGSVEHVEDLSFDLRKDPRPVLAGELAAVLDRAGSIVVYDASSERRLLAALARAAPAHAAPLDRARERVWDLLAVLQKTVRHPGLAGRWDLKRAASVLAGFRYPAVGVQDGLSAQALWRRSLSSRQPAAGKALREYCAADSRAMLRIVHALRTHTDAEDEGASEGGQSA